MGVTGLLNAEIVLNSLIDSPGECIVAINKFGIVEIFSQAYADFIGVDRAEQIGRHVNDLAPTNGLMNVLKTGEIEKASIWEWGGKKLILFRAPIVKDGEIIGVFAKVLLRDTQEIGILWGKLRNLEQSLTLYKSTITNSHTAKHSLDSIVTNDPEMLKIKEIARRVSRNNSGVLVTGETGTGKELVAHSIHNLSSRVGGPFVTANCGAIPQELLESELFGYEAGAFTGAARSGKLGLLKIADGGTIFLDEIGDLPLALQVKLLRFLQEKEIKRIGSNTTEKINARVIAATNRDLQKMVADGSFRSDFYYRLCVVHIQVPPLRDRKDDIPLLADHLAKKICAWNGIKKVKIDAEAMRALRSYDWPGNVRELENVLESAITFVDRDRTIRANLLPAKLRPAGGVSGETMFFPCRDLKTALRVYEKQYIAAALAQNNNHKAKTAKMLGISRTQLYEKLRLCGIGTKSREEGGRENDV
jgi:transcriptional regulator with PAS, ATPase and Fis domain